jgi:hypothetical protein
MNIPNYDYSPITERDGNLSPIWSLIIQQLLSVLQTNLSDTGYILPQLTTTQIAALQASFALAPNPSLYYGDMVYDSTLNEVKVNIAGTFKVVTVT